MEHELVEMSQRAEYPKTVAVRHELIGTLLLIYPESFHNLQCHLAAQQQSSTCPPLGGDLATRPGVHYFDRPVASMQRLPEGIYIFDQIVATKHNLNHALQFWLARLAQGICWAETYVVRFLPNRFYEVLKQCWKKLQYFTLNFGITFLNHEVVETFLCKHKTRRVIIYCGGAVRSICIANNLPLSQQLYNNGNCF